MEMMRFRKPIVIVVWSVFKVSLRQKTHYLKYVIDDRTRGRFPSRCHYGDVIMGAIASQITSLTIVYSTVHSDADQRKHQSSASLAFVWGIHQGPVNSPHKWPVTRKMFPFDDVIINHTKTKTNHTTIPDAYIIARTCAAVVCHNKPVELTVVQTAVE